MPIFRILLLLILFSILTLKKLPLFISLFLTTLALGGFFLSPEHILMGLVHGLTSTESLSLMFLIWITVSFTRLIEKGGGISSAATILMEKTSNPRLLFPFFPALIGLFPMPGGALVSAPMLATMSRDGDMTGSQQAAVNFWFRHVWESVWPLYPSIILSAGLLDAEFSEIISHQYFLAAAAIAGGYLFLILPGAKKYAGERKGKFPFLTLLYHLWPIALLVLGIIAGNFTLPVIKRGMRLLFSGDVPSHIKDLSQFVYMTLLIIVIALLYSLQKKLSFKKGVLSSLKEGFSLKLILLIPVIFTFKSYVEHTGITDAMKALSSSAVPEEIVIFTVPLILGLLFGIAVAFVSVGLPLLTGILIPAGAVDWSLFALFFLGGYIGILFSPMHLCLLVSKEYFNGSLLKIYKSMILPGLFLLIFGLILNILLN